MAKNHLENGRVDQTMVMDILYEIAFVPNQNTHTRQPSNLPPQQLVSRWAPPNFDGDRAVSRLAEISSGQASRSLSRSTVISTSTVSHKPSESTNTTVSQSVAESLPSPSSRSTSMVSHKPSETNKTSVDPPVIEPLPFVPVKSKAEHEAEKLDPIYVESARDVDNLFREMLPFFEGAESEQNWKHREQSTLKVRKVTKGNAYDDFPTTYLAGIKLLLNGLIGVAESLRTTQCTLGCHCIQDVVRRTGPNLDPMVEILLQSLMKLCGQTKKISAANGDMSVTCIISQVSFNARLAQHIYLATQDKNVSPRLFACGWLMTILTKHGHHKSAIDHNGALESINKSITAGLMDRDASVRTRMRPTYWAFARLWNDRSERYCLHHLVSFALLIRMLVFFCPWTRSNSNFFSRMQAIHFQTPPRLRQHLVRKQQSFLKAPRLYLLVRQSRRPWQKTVPTEPYLQHGLRPLAHPYHPPENIIFTLPQNQL